MKKIKLLCILHFSPPAHGASKVGDFIKTSKKLEDKFDCKFIKIKSSDNLEDIGKMNIKKFYLFFELYFKVFFTIFTFRPDKIYFTASSKGFAFYRDLLLSTIWKLYGLFKFCDVYYHYHTKGISKFVKNKKNKKLTQFFLKNINVILLSPKLKNDFNDVKTFKKILYLPNGVENNFNKNEFEHYISQKNFKNLNILFLSNMIKEKGYFDVLKLASTNKTYHFHFAGAWKSRDEEKNFFNYIEKHNLKENVTYHGFVKGKQKKELFEKSHILCFPSKNEAFPLTILEAFSYGLPVLTTSVGSIPYILDKKTGIMIKDIKEINDAFIKIKDDFVNLDTSYYCRNRYLENFSLEQFEENLLKVLK